MYLQIIIEHGKNQISFTGRDYYFLSKAYDMLTQGNVMINRAAHESKISISLNKHLIVMFNNNSNRVFNSNV